MGFQLVLSVLAVSACLVSSAPNGLSETLSAFQGIGPVIGGGKQVLGQDDHDILAMQWLEFKERHQKSYLTAEDEELRFGIFKTNMAKVKLLQQSEMGTASYGPTMFADMTEEEFSQYVMSPKYFARGHDLKYDDIPRDPAPASFDWRDKGAVTEVKNQGSCGSCWAFSTTGNVEGQWFIKKGQLVSLSEQELVSCDKVDDGCEGGLPSQAYQQIMKLGGLDAEKDYPYDGIDEKCALKANPAVYINDSVAISSNEDDMAAWLAKNGPISIGINANVMQFYMGGISHPWKILCSPSHLDHGVLIVGYGTENGTPYWIIKNSWGPSWGEKGYYRAYRGDGVCGLNKMCTSSVVN